MTKALLVSASLLALGTALVGCEVHDNTINATANIPNAKLTVTADTDVDNVEPMQMVPMTVVVEHVYLVDPAAPVPAGHEKDAGHLEFHVDDETTTAVLVTAQTNVQVPIPVDTKPGKHKVICRVHKHDGEPTDTKFEINISVKATVTTTTSGTAGTGGGAGTSGGAGTGAAGTSGGAGSAGPDGGSTTTTVTVEVDASVSGTL